jgi:hypothetical protein
MVRAYLRAWCCGCLCMWCAAFCGSWLPGSLSACVPEYLGVSDREWHSLTHLTGLLLDEVDVSAVSRPRVERASALLSRLPIR